LSTVLSLPKRRRSRPVEVVIAQIHDCLEVQRAMRAEKDLQEKDVGKRGSVE
jgi:hypothetical protein